MGPDTAILTDGNVTVDVHSRSKKEPDWGWGPRKPPPGTLKRPTVVLEVAVTDTHAKLLRDVDLWLDPLRGNTTIVIAVKLTSGLRGQRVVIKKFERGEIDGKPVCSQRIQCHRYPMPYQSDVHVRGPPLTIPFDVLFLRDPVNAEETDSTLGRQELQEIAEWAWDVGE
ncbi:hypothetical protein N7520_009896 [Penicillium odoratum]|uniref:uncharacterized protein n=1 Tax=Penicillium odoratum TaxID=1167516 RepID=UPI002548615A|nr:uncharacterized protein N7520_009896 [Penicillium odoratum]KAJ5752979.1 hypothetical protein N7520_009896 [Penicillium odoratum]